jgi:hypothetical protein
MGSGYTDKDTHIQQQQQTNGDIHCNTSFLQTIKFVDLGSLGALTLLCKLTAEVFTF